MTAVVADRSLVQRALGVKQRSDVRQVATVAIYLGLLSAMYFVPACRNVPCYLAACAYSFLTAVVGHNTLHQAMFEAKWKNSALRYVLSFAGLFPTSAVIPAHNLVHHHFEDDGQPDWAAPGIVRFRWNLLNLLHFPNVAGPLTFNGVQRWAKIRGRGAFRGQYTRELIFAFGLTGALLVRDFWAGLFFVVLPQLWGARSFLRVNILQHDGCDLASRWNHSRNFVGKLFNWFMMNNGYHTAHHSRAGVHFEGLPALHDREFKPYMEARLNEPSMLGYLFRVYGLPGTRPRAPVAEAVERHEEKQARTVPATEAWVEDGDPNADEVAA